MGAVQRTKIITKAILKRPDGKVLLLRRSETDTRRPLQWDFPGGNQDPGEHVDDAIVREIEEEAGLKISSDNLRAVHVSGQEYRLDSVPCPLYCVWLFYIGATSDSEAAVKLSFEHDKFTWVEPSKLKDMLEYPVHKEIIAKLLADAII